MIQLSMELPTSRLTEWTPLADLDFILAHTVLEDDAYAEFFRKRPAGREVILDNSYHELGYALEPGDLLEAARRCRADYIITPDDVNDKEFTLKSYHAFQAYCTGFKLAVVWTGFRAGSLLSEREDFLHQVVDADMLCCTFKLKQRLAYFQQSFIARNWKRVHLLGVDTLAELAEWNKMARYLSKSVFSVDTGKALKWALRGRKLNSLESLRTSEATTSTGAPSTASQHILRLTKEDITSECEALFLHNVATLKEICK